LNVFTPENELEYESHQSPNIKIQYTILTKVGEFKHFKTIIYESKGFRVLELRDHIFDISYCGTRIGNKVTQNPCLRIQNYR